MSAFPLPHITPEQYLALDRAAEVRSEYYEGEMYAMAGGTKNHSVIAGDCYAVLQRTAEERGCRAYIMNVRVEVAKPGPYFYPDLLVECDASSNADPPDMVSRPIVIVEVLSDSTEDFDRGRKFIAYSTLPSLREYVLIAQSSPDITVFRRQRDESWELRRITDATASLHLESLDADIALADIYAHVEFPE